MLKAALLTSGVNFPDSNGQFANAFQFSEGAWLREASVPPTRASAECLTSIRSATHLSLYQACVLACTEQHIKPGKSVALRLPCFGKSRALALQARSLICQVDEDTGACASAAVTAVFITRAWRCAPPQPRTHCGSGRAVWHTRQCGPEPGAAR